MPMPAQLLVQGGCGLQYQTSADLVNRLCLLACTHHHLWPSSTTNDCQGILRRRGLSAAPISSSYVVSKTWKGCLARARLPTYSLNEAAVSAVTCKNTPLRTESVNFLTCTLQQRHANVVNQ